MNNSTETHGVWSATAPSHPALSPVEGERKTDVAVVGGGYTGLSAALYLAEAGTDVTLLEAKSIGYGGSGRNVGLVNAGLWLMPDEVVKIMGPEYGERVLEVLGASPDLVFELINKHGIECEAVREGTLHCAHSPAGYKALQKREEQWQRRNAPVTLLSREKAAPMIGSNAFHGALWDKRAGRIQPLAYAYGLAEIAKKAGAKLHSNSPVISCRRDGDSWRLKTPNGVVVAKFVILTVQGYPDYAFKNQKKSMVPFNYFQFSTPPLPESVRKTILPGQQPAWDTNLILSSYRLDNAGRLIVGSVGQARHGAYGLHKSWALRSVKKVFPQIGTIELEHAWDGIIRMTTDNVPRFHLLDKGMITVTSYNGRGIGPGTVFGKLLAEYTQTESPSCIPLPLTQQNEIWTRQLRGFFYEAGARLYHFAQRRI
ncbi:MAG: FAD-binding oxidoreductase [Verrucomicrobia bacterium]|nr:FAD-binding oxidoreductase [Verrucomicrobiota bacterium]